jgi:TolB-like protein
MAAQLTRTPEPLNEIRPEIPSELSDLIMRCLEKNPAFRPSTAVALQAELDAVSTPRGAVLTSGETDFFGAQRQSTARGALMGAAFVVLASVGTYAFVAFRDEKPRTSDTVTVVAPTPPAPAPVRPAAKPAAPVDSARIAAAFSGVTTPAATAPQPVVLSRADSLAIAEAVTARLEGERATAGERDRALSDSLRTVYERAFSDSIRSAIASLQAQVQAATDVGQRVRIETMRGERAPLPRPRPDERRVVVVPFSNPSSGGSRLSTSGPGDQIADSIRNALRAGGTLSVVEEEMTRDIARIGRVPTMIGAMLYAPAIVTGEYRRRGDSLLVRAQVTCLTCGALGIREVTVAASQATSAVPLLLEPLLSDLAKVRWSPPTRGGSGTGRGNPAPSAGRVGIPNPPPPPPP